MEYGKIIFFFLSIFLVPIALADEVDWVDTKEVKNSHITIESPQSFTNCVLTPDGMGDYDTCSAYLIIKNSNGAFEPSDLRFATSFLRGNTRNAKIEYTKNFYSSFRNHTSLSIINNETKKDNLTTKIDNSIETKEETIPTMIFSDFTPNVPRINDVDSIGVRITFEKKKWTSDFFNFEAKMRNYEILLDPEVDACGTLSTDGGYYTLNTSVTSAGTCFTIGANNITLDGAGYYVNYSTSSAGYAITDSGNRNNITIKNLKIIENRTSGTDDYAIYFNGILTNSIITNNSVTTKGTNSHAILLYSQSGTISFNNISYNTVNNTVGGASIFLLGYLSSSVNSTIIDNNTVYGGGIVLQTKHANNIITNNVVPYVHYGNKDGIGLWHNGNNNTVLNNTILDADRVGIILSTNSYSNITNNNVTVLVPASGFSGRNGLYFQSNSTYNIISNNTVDADGGAYLVYSNSNIFSNNTITKVTNPPPYHPFRTGVKISFSYNNSFFNDSINGESNFDYSIDENTYANNTFNKTNFTNGRIIQFSAYNNAHFNYSHDGAIWLDTFLKSGYSTLRTRNINYWSKNYTEWKDVYGYGAGDNLNITLGYKIDGLTPSKRYSVYRDNRNIIYENETEANGSISFNSYVGLLIGDSGSNKISFDTIKLSNTSVSETQIPQFIGATTISTDANDSTGSISSLKVGIILNNTETNYTMIKGAGDKWTYVFSSGVLGEYTVKNFHVTGSDGINRTYINEITFSVVERKASGAPSAPSAPSTPKKALPQETPQVINLKTLPQDPTGNIALEIILLVGIIILLYGIFFTSNHDWSILGGAMLFMGSYALGLI